MSEVVHNGPDDEAHARGMELSGDPDPDVPAGPGLLPLDVWHRAKGARMVEFAGYEMPIQYDGIMAGASLDPRIGGAVRRQPHGQLELSGEDVAAALEALVPGTFRRSSREGCGIRCCSARAAESWTT